MPRAQPFALAWNVGFHEGWQRRMGADLPNLASQTPRGGRIGAVPTRSSVRLLEVEPDIGLFLAEEDLSLARLVTVPVRTVGRGTKDVGLLVQQAGAFASLLLEGMLVQELQLGDRMAMRLLGPGDIVAAPGGLMLDFLDGSELRAASPVSLALLGKELLSAARRWPALIAGLHLQSGQQTERLSAQLLICQMPRVEDRLIALLWLLAGSWGRVTTNGTVLPLKLTHGTLGALIGARRPTVTLALGELAERGAIISQGDGWLLVERPQAGAASAADMQLPVIVRGTRSVWTDLRNGSSRRPDEDLAAAYDELKDTVDQLRDRYQRDRERTRVRLAAVRSTRESCGATRQRIARERLTRRRTPSS